MNVQGLLGFFSILALSDSRYRLIVYYVVLPHNEQRVHFPISMLQQC